MKKVLLILLIMFPVLINATCDQAKHTENLKVADTISFDNTYNKDTNTFTFTLYNIPTGYFVKVGNRNFYSDNENKVVFQNIRPGGNISISIYADDGCDSIKYYGMNEPYFNPYYDTYDCYGYEDKISYCANEFTDSPVKKEDLESAKYYYDHTYSQETKNNTKRQNLSFWDMLKLYIQEWWIKVALVALTTIISISIFSVKYRKIKHGI